MQPRAQEPPNSVPPDDPWARRGLLAVLCAGVLVRLLYLIELPTYPAYHQPEADAWHYQELARRIAAGDWLLDGTPARMSPGYTYFLGVVQMLLGDGARAIRLVQMGLGLATVALLWGAARHLVGARWALLPAAVAALYGPFIYFEGHLLAAALGVFLHAALLCAALSLLSRARVAAWAWLLLGLLWGLCCLVRPNALLLVLAIAVGLFERGRRPGCWAWARNLVMVVLGGALAILPLTVRNGLATGEVVLLTSHGGINFYVGNGPGATGSWRAVAGLPEAASSSHHFDAFHRAAEQELGRRLGQQEADAYWYGRTRDAVLDDPGAWLRVMARKLHLFWNGRELHNIYDYELWREIGLLLGAPLPQFLWIAPLGLVGAVWMLRSSRMPRFVALFVWCSCVAVVLVFVTDRYRLPAVTGVLLCATVALRELVARARARDARGVASLAVATTLALLLALPVAVRKQHHEKYSRLGTAWLQLGDLPRARWAYDTALAARADFLPAREGLALLHERAGRDAEALDAWRAVERLANLQGDDAALQRARDALAGSAKTYPAKTGP